MNVKSFLRELFFLGVRATLFPYIMREIFHRKGVTIICFHDIPPDKARTIFGFFKRRYSIISLSKFLEARRSSTMDALPPKPLVITFDDGHRGNFHLKSVLSQYPKDVTIFLCASIINTRRHFWWHEADAKIRDQGKEVPDEERLRLLRERGFTEEKEYESPQALSDSELAALEPMVDFQAHTLLHPVLIQCSDERARREIFQSKEDLQSRYGYAINALAYPNGDWSSREARFAREAGFECALTLDPGVNTGRTDMFALKRYCMYDEGGPNEALVKASGFWDLLPFQK